MDQYNTKGQIQQKRINTTKRNKKIPKTKQKIPMTLIQPKKKQYDQYDHERPI